MSTVEEKENIVWWKEEQVKEAIYNAQNKVVNAGLDIMTRDFVHFVLKDAGVKQGENKPRDYSLCKKLLVNGHWIDSDVYDRIIGYITDYIGTT